MWLGPTRFDRLVAVGNRFSFPQGSVHHVQLGEVTYTCRDDGGTLSGVPATKTCPAEV